MADNNTDVPTPTKPRADLRDYLAAERTLLAWIRTGLALMGFGFVVARFGLFLQELQAAQHAHSAQAYGLSLWFGTGLMAVGVIVNVFAGWRHARLVRELDRGDTSYSLGSTQAVAIAFFLALVGLAMAIYLISIRSSTRPQLENREEASMPHSEAYLAYPRTAGDCPNFARSSEQGTDRRLVGTFPFSEAVWG